jgi:GDP-4-dehydro-6-deoxy-D-mannose reductase
MKALCIGSKGFVSGYLVEELLQQGWEVDGMNLRDGQDIRNYETVRNAIDICKPDAIFLLAAQAAPAESFHNPNRTFEVNILGSTNVLEAVRQLGLKTRILLCGTSEEYGPQEPLEDGVLEPRSPYAISKMAMTQMGLLYAKAYGLHVVVTRAFNHTGPGRSEVYMESSFAKQIAQIEANKRIFLEHGNLSSIRNFTDVRDVVRAYVKAIDLPNGVYNICSENNVSVRDVVGILTKRASCDILLQKNDSLIRPADFSFRQPRCDKFKKLTGWKAEIPLEQTLQEILDYWRDRV